MNSRIPGDLQDRLRKQLAMVAGQFAAGLLLTPVRDATPEDDVSVQLPHPFSNMDRRDWTDSINTWKAIGAPLLAELPSRACPACGTNEPAEPIFESYDGYPYSECVSCGVWFVPLKVDGELFERYFQLAPDARRYGDYTQVQAADAGVEANDRARFSAYLMDLTECLGRTPATLLDIGCGVGNSLATAQGFGIDGYGLEVNARAIDAARALGRRVFPSPEEMPIERFDVVAIWETLEHLDDPFSALKAAKTLLKLDGLLSITVPNLNSPSIRSMRGDSMHIHGGPAWPGHINLFAPATLTRLLERSGFRVVDIRGQFSANLYELAAYHLGTWAGARDYLRGASDCIRLPSATKLWLDAISPAFAYAEESFAIAPIMRVLATHADQRPSDSVVRFQNAQRERLSQRLRSLSGTPPDMAFSGRGEPISLNAYTFVDPAVHPCGNDGLRLEGAQLAAFTYLWKSPAIELDAGDVVRLRGRLYGGGISFGLQVGERWGDTRVREAPGVFEIAVQARTPGLHEIVIANHNEGTSPTSVDFDRLERIRAAVAAHD